jgi:ribosomal protein L11 methylase PrmA
LANWIKKIEPQTVWDFGANDGRYSRIAADIGAHVTAFDIDPIAVERNSNKAKRQKTDILPLVLDLTIRPCHRICQSRTLLD